MHRLKDSSYHGGFGGSFGVTVIDVPTEESKDFLLALPAVISVCLDHVSGCLLCRYSPRYLPALWCFQSLVMHVVFTDPLVFARHDPYDYISHG